MRKRSDEGALVKTECMNEPMKETPKRGFKFSFDIGYTIDGRRSDIFVVEISTI